MNLFKTRKIVAFLMIIASNSLAKAQPVYSFQVELDSMNLLLEKCKTDTARARQYINLSHYFGNFGYNDTALIVAEKAYELVENDLDNIGNKTNSKKHFRFLVDISERLALLYSEQGPESKVYKYCNSGIAYSKEIGYEIGQGRCLRILARLNGIAGNLDESERLFQKAMKLLKTVEDKKGLSSALISLGDQYSITKSNEKAKLVYIEALTIKREIKDKKGLVVALNCLANCNASLGQFTEAVNNYFEALEVSEMLANKKLIAMTLGNLGCYYLNQDLNEKALKYLKESYKINEKINDSFGLAFCSNSIGVCHSRLNNFDKSIQSYLKSLQFFEKLNVKERVAICQYNIGKNYIRLDSIVKAEEYFHFALKLSKKISYAKMQGKALVELGFIALDRADNNTALKYGKSAYLIVEETNNVKLKRNLNRLLSEVYEVKNKGMLALKHYKSYINLRDSLINIDAQREIIEKEAQVKIQRNTDSTKYELLKKESHIMELAKENLIKKRTIQASILVGALILSIAFFWFKSFKKKKRFIEMQMEQKIEYYMAEIDLLQATIHLHKERKNLNIKVIKQNINKYLHTPLSKRELDVLIELSKGMSNTDIADNLFISINTVKTHLANVYEKLEVKNRLQAVKMTEHFFED